MNEAQEIDYAYHADSCFCSSLEGVSCRRARTKSLPWMQN
jgi:hypothetical protein